MTDLLILRGTTVERRIALGEYLGPLRLGRSPENDIELPDPGKAVSRTHAELRRLDGDFVLIDLNSENGLWLDGERLPQVALSTEAAVTVGPYRLLLGPGSGDSETVFRPLPAQTRTAAPSRAVGLGARLPPQLRSRAALGSVTAVALVLLLWLLPRSFRDPMPTVTRGVPQAPAGEQPSPASVSTPGKRAEQDVTQARQFVALNNCANAMAAIGQALQADSSNAEALLLKQQCEEQTARLAATTLRSAPTVAAPLTVVARPADAAVPVTSTPPPRPAVALGPASSSGGFQVSRRQGERERDYRARAKQLQEQFTAAASQVEAGDSAGAIAKVQALLAEEPRQPDVEALLGRAQEHLRRAVVQEARDTFDAAAKLEAQGNLAAADQQYQRARQLDATLPGMDQALARVRSQRIAMGTAALKNARQYDGMFRVTDALTEYQRALMLLPPDHPDFAVATERVRALRAGK